ncbi:DUF2336 domain-containing protein [Limoniibacter endophyticus]|uniref:DUF2336 domain-containing protein n=1 Tax=Limoniibacter endophyticus TaxID=1565040 RepID=A0A8J3DDI8_9HYPH|nr:DUF2336 domain-containing protein [Limoniibacter endophyticus]GHC60203.1 hypothetical protein GCM10010136_00080 [Limoniibacter endophyticus]
MLGGEHGAAGQVADMVIGDFLKWTRNASATDRAAAATALAHAYLVDELDLDTRCAAEAALTYLLDDPSPKVRLALAEVLAHSPGAPIQVISGLADDNPDIAGLVLARSPILQEYDLVDRVFAGRTDTQCAIAGRPQVPMALSAAIAEVGCAESCVALLRNDGADIKALSFRRMSERHGAVADVRGALLDDVRLPSDCRYHLLDHVSQALASSPLLLRVVGEARADRLTREACSRASVQILDLTPVEDFPALISHLRLSGELTTSFLIRTVTHGKIDFFGAALSALTGQSETRVRLILSSRQRSVLVALFAKAGLPASAHQILGDAIFLWHDVARGKRLAGAQEISYELLQRTSCEPGGRGDLARLLKGIHVDLLRQNARNHAVEIAAA